MINNEIIQGSALERLKELESESVDCCITSPPYWALRDYKTEGQLGLEPTFTEYISKLIQIFNEVKRVLKKTGSCWVDIGDMYSTSPVGHFVEQRGIWNGKKNTEKGKLSESLPDRTKFGIPEKSLMLIPQRLQIAMVDAGWICRNTIIWYKPNCMPSSAKDRFTVDFEYLFFFTKSQRYFFDTQYEPYDDSKPNGWREDGAIFGGKKHAGYETNLHSGKEWNPSPFGRIKRCVWKIPTQPFSDAHFAVFPPELVETPIKATCPEYICKQCGKAREKILGPAKYKPVESYGDKWRDSKDNILRNMKALRDIQGEHDNIDWSRDVIGLTSCDCNAGYDAGIVLDPFIGSGTVGLVALQNARNFIGIELNPEYIKMAYARLDPYLKAAKDDRVRLIEMRKNFCPKCNKTVFYFEAACHYHGKRQESKISQKMSHSIICLGK